VLTYAVHAIRAAAVAGLALLMVPDDAGAVRAAAKKRAPATRRVARPAVHRPFMPAVIVPAAASARDIEIGEACRRGLGDTRGAVVAMDPYTGRVISMVNPADAMLSAHQPCSVFKIVVAVAGLTEGAITPETIHDCHGGCWMWPGHGPIDLRRALAQSCNPYFEAIGERLGYDTVQRYSFLLGLGAATGINLEGESAGRIPASVPQSRVGHLSSHAAGIKTSVVQIAVLMSAMLNGGIIFQPQVSGPGGFVAHERWRLPPRTVMGGLAEGFLSAVNEGSASNAFDPDVIVAGKTGTCSGLGWFASYAPADRPEVVIVTMVRPGNGHAASAVAGRIYQRLYKPAPLPIVSAGGG
jgi:cell division protein FtsI/penicillin-binding protein 2